MKKTHFIFLVTILAIASCDKNEKSPEITPPDDNSDGNLILVTRGRIMSIDANLSPVASGTWSCRKGTNANTNSINF